MATGPGESSSCRTRVGDWSYVTHSEIPALNGKTGDFTCVKPSAGNR
jgi:hypothetical protein